MFLSRILTASASFFRRLPLQAGQTFIIMYFSISARVNSESVSFHLRLRFGITPSNADSSRPPSSPYKMRSTIFFESSETGVFKENLFRSARSESIHQYHDCLPTRCDADAQGRIAPSASVNRLFGNTSSGSTSRFEPSPVHSGHAPYGLLNENILGSISGRSTPHSTHENFSENI